jgi:type II secretory pathway component GspD/PulD (secretin)
MEQSMLLSGIRRKQKARAFLSLSLIALCTLVILFSIEAFSASAMRSRVYGFRNTDNKEAMQLVGKLGFKVTIDAHSSSVVVLTGDDAEELTRAYTLMEVADQKEPVLLKVLGLIPDSKAQDVIDELHTQLKTLNIGTLLNPPAKAVADPLIVDIYQGELIAVAAESQIGKIETAYKNLQSQKQPPQPVVSEPNIPASAPAVVSVPVEPNKIEIPMAVAEPNIPKPQPKPLPEQVKSVVAEPNQPVLPETPVVQPAAAVSVQPQAVEPNQTKPQEPGTQEDFISSELLKTLDVEEKKVEAQKAAMAKPQPVETKDASAPEPTKEITGDEFKKIIAQLMKQAAEEEKKTTAGQVPDANASGPDTGQIAIEEQAGKPEEKKEEQAALAKTPAEVSQQPQKEAVKPVVPESKPKTGKTAKTEAVSKTTKGKSPAAADLKDKAAESEPSISKGEEELELTITLPEKVEIKQLIELVGKQLGLNYMYDETKIKGEVTLKVYEGKIKVKDCYALLESVLRYKGFVMTRRGNLVTIVPAAEIGSSDPKIRMPDQPIEQGDIIVNGVFPLKYVNFNNAQNILRSLSLGTNIIPVPETNTLIVTDYSYRMAKIDEILKFLDVQGKPKIFANRQLEYMQAAILIPRLQSLASQLENLSITVGISAATTPSPGMSTRIDPRTGQPMAAGPMPQISQPPSSGSAPQQQTVYLDADERTNRILMVGTEEQLKTVNELIDTLDVRQHFLRFVKEYEIKNVDASEVINVLNELGLATVSMTTKSSDQTARQATPQMTRPGQPTRPGMPPGQQVAAAAAQGSAAVDQPSISIRPNTNSLLVNATIEQHEDIELVIKHIDVTQKDQRTIEEYEIQNVDAKEVVQTLGDLSIISKDSVSNITTSKSSMYDSQMSSRSGRSGRSGNQQSPFPQQGIPGGEGVQEPSAMVSLPLAEGGTVRELITTEPQISILETTNSLLIYATPRQHASVALVIAHVDRELSETTAPYVVYPLENQDPEELADTLTSLIEGTAKKATTSSGQTKQSGMAPSPMDNRIRTEQTESVLPKKEEERITIIPDKKSYSLIVYANKKNQQWVATLIKQLDQYRPQVLLGCTLVEITKDDQFTFDLDLVSRSGGFPAGGSMMQLTAINQAPSTATIPGFPATRGTFEGTVNKGTGAAFYADDHIQALLNLVDKNNYGRVLARPSLLVKDNEEGIIKAEKTIYVAEEKSNILPTNTDTNNTPYTTTDVTFTPYKSDITLTITPHITSEKILQLEILLNRTDFDLSSGKTVEVGTRTIPKPFDQITSNVDTWSIIPDGATIILGGIETINQGKTNTKVPILGDIPLVGLLFRGIDQTDKQSKLYVFVKANIIKPADVLTGQSDIERISQKKRQDFEREEAKFQRLQALPGVKPTPMDPEKILEDDEYIHKVKEQQPQGNVVTVPLN